ncbi:MAG: HAD-IB family hydrolase [Solirubrobacteraceae bacterium]|nr:HAD-IB family hydrolase [Solirubrobacteraceae bacterium]
MTTTADLIARVEAAPPGPATIAAFDYDGTLVAGLSASAFMRERVRRRQMGAAELVGLLRAARRGIESDEAFASFLDGALSHWTGQRADDLDALGMRLFKHRTAALLRRETYAVLEAHRRMGHTLVIASSALTFQTAPVARALEVDHVVCTRAAVDDGGRLTGRADGVPVYGREKARRVLELVDALGADPADAFAYSDGGEDEPLLAAVGHAAAIEPDDDLLRAAARHGWPVLPCRDPAPRATLTDAARTVAFYGGFAGAMGAAAGIGLARRSRRSFLDIAFGVGADVSLAAAGVDVRVLSGSAHLWDARPCVFVFNHASKVDTIVMAKLLRQDFTGVAKAEAKNVPMFGQLFQLAGIALIDRADAQGARAKMEPLIQRLREGTSVAVSPEGTRTPTPRLGPFKKGPFHIAMQAGVPVVPILFRGIDEVQWRGAQIVRPGTVEVVVLPPVDTSEWLPETVDRHRDDVRALMLDGLDAWPTDRPARLTAGATR